MSLLQKISCLNLLPAAIWMPSTIPNAAMSLMMKLWSISSGCGANLKRLTRSLPNCSRNSVLLPRQRAAARLRTAPLKELLNPCARPTVNFRAKTTHRLQEMKNLQALWAMFQKLLTVCSSSTTTLLKNSASKAGKMPNSGNLLNRSGRKAGNRLKTSAWQRSKARSSRE